MEDVNKKMLKEIVSLKEYVYTNSNSKKIDIYVLRNIIFKIIENTTFLDNLRQSNDNFFIKKDPLLVEIFDNRKEDYIKAAFFGKEEQIKISLVSIIDQLAHIGKENGFKNKAIISGLNKRSSKDFEYSNDKVINEFNSKSEEWYDKTNSSLDMKRLKQVYELSGARKNDENIKYQDLRKFNDAMNYKEIEEILFDLKELVMIECIKDKKINKAIYLKERVENNGEKYMRLAINTNEQYMLTEAHIKEKMYKNLSRIYTNSVKKINNIPRSLSTSFPIFLNKDEWLLEEKYKNAKNDYRTNYRHIRNKYEEYDKIAKEEKEKLYDN